MPISILIKQWMGSPCSLICGVLIGFALYSKKACSLINPFDDVGHDVGTQGPNVRAFGSRTSARLDKRYSARPIHNQNSSLAARQGRRLLSFHCSMQLLLPACPRTRQGE